MPNAPFPPTPCQVVRCEWSDGYVSEYVGDSPRTSAEYVSSVYDAIAVPRAQWEAVEAFIAAEYARRRAYKKWLHGGTEYINDLQTTDRFEREALDALLTFFHEAP